MNLSELIHEVWKKSRDNGINVKKGDIKSIVKITVEEMTNNLFKFGTLKIHGLFTLKITKNKGRRITNPQTKEHMYIDDYYKISLIPSKKIKKLLRKYGA